MTMTVVVAGLVAVEFLIGVLGFAMTGGVNTTVCSVLFIITAALSLSEYAICLRAYMNMAAVADWGADTAKNEGHCWLIVAWLHLFLLYLCL